MTTYNRGMQSSSYWDRLRQILRGEPVSDGIPVPLRRRTEGERSAYVQGHAAGKRAGFADAARHVRAHVVPVGWSARDAMDGLASDLDRWAELVGVPGFEPWMLSAPECQHDIERLLAERRAAK